MPTMKRTVRACYEAAKYKPVGDEIENSLMSMLPAELKATILQDALHPLDYYQAIEFVKHSNDEQVRRAFLQRCVSIVEQTTVLKRKTTQLVPLANDLTDCAQDILLHFDVTAFPYTASFHPQLQKPPPSEAFMYAVYNIACRTAFDLKDLKERETEALGYEHLMRPHGTMQAFLQIAPAHLLQAYQIQWSNERMQSVFYPDMPLIFTDRENMLNNDTNQLIVPPIVKLEMGVKLNSESFLSHAIIEQLQINHDGRECSNKPLRATYRGGPFWVLLYVYCVARLPHSTSGHQPLYDAVLGDLPRVFAALQRDDRNITALRNILTKFAPMNLSNDDYLGRAYKHFIVRRYNTPLPDTTFTPNVDIEKQLDALILKTEGILRSSRT